jgi:uncharacterized protein
MTIMPMFPLGTPLLPAMPLSLRIFEERYLKLLGDLIAQDKPEFGVVLIERGQEVGGSDKRMLIGTIASVTDIGTLDEFYGLESFGSQRFRVNAWLPDDPYPLADIELIDDLVWDTSLEPARVELERWVRKLLAFASEFGDLQYDADIEFSDDPVDACWQLAGVLPVGALDLADLLKSESVAELISKTSDIVSALDQALQAMMQNINDEPDSFLS